MGSRVSYCYIFKPEIKKDTILLAVELLAVTCVQLYIFEAPCTKQYNIFVLVCNLGRIMIRSIL